jgi:polysaccharide export outer membrane protein
VIHIQVYGEEDLTVERKVGGDGKIDYPLLGLVQATGLTTRELQASLTEKLRAGYLKHPRVTVAIAKHRNFYVNGEVKTAGGYPYEEGLTVQRALSIAGGFTERASRTELQIERRTEEGVAVIPVDAASVVLPDDLILVATAKRIYVEGEVKRPGDFGYERGLTVYKAITMAGGFTEKASKKPSVLRTINGHEEALQLELDAPVLPNDIIVVSQRFF